MSEMIRLFEGKQHAHVYSKFRPKTPKVVAETAVNYLRRKNPLSNDTDQYQCMVDVGCGSGQSTELFAPYFAKIYGIDVSPNQIANASNNFPHIHYVVGSGESLPTDDESVDLVTSGQAVHWMDLQAFLNECHRVLKPKGCMLLYGYDYLCMYPGFDSMIDKDQMVSSGVKVVSDIIKKCRFHPRLKELDDHYRRIYGEIASDHKERFDNIKMKAQWTLTNVKNHFRTWSGYQAVMKEKLDELEKELGEEKITEDLLMEHDPIVKFSEDLKKAWKVENVEDNDIKINIEWDTFIIMSGRPHKQ